MLILLNTTWHNDVLRIPCIDSDSQQRKKRSHLHSSELVVSTAWKAGPFLSDGNSCWLHAPLHLLEGQYQYLCSVLFFNVKLDISIIVSHFQQMSFACTVVSNVTMHESVWSVHAHVLKSSGSELHMQLHRDTLYVHVIACHAPLMSIKSTQLSLSLLIADVCLDVGSKGTLSCAVSTFKNCMRCMKLILKKCQPLRGENEDLQYYFKSYASWTCLHQNICDTVNGPFNTIILLLSSVACFMCSIHVMYLK